LGRRSSGRLQLRCLSADCSSQSKRPALGVWNLNATMCLCTEGLRCHGLMGLLAAVEEVHGSCASASMSGRVHFIVIQKARANGHRVHRHHSAFVEVDRQPADRLVKVLSARTRIMCRPRTVSSLQPLLFPNPPIILSIYI
jgi:hypothetical protein